MKITTIILISLISLNCFAVELICEAWYQERGMSLEKQSMQVTSVTANEKNYRTSFRGFEFEVNWNYELTTLYTFIKKNDENILFTTARIPTENHPEAFTDLNIPNGPRLSVNCGVH